MFLRRLMWRLHRQHALCPVGTGPAGRYCTSAPGAGSTERGNAAAGRTQAPNASKPGPGGFKHCRSDHASGEFVVPPGTRILLNMINSVSTRQAAVGDRLYLQTAFPIFANGHIVIPQGSGLGHHNPSEAARPCKRTRGNVCALRFADSANGVSRDFRRRALAPWMAAPVRM